MQSLTGLIVVSLVLRESEKTALRLGKTSSESGLNGTAAVSEARKGNWVASLVTRRVSFCRKQQN